MRPNILCQDCHASQVWTTVLMPLPCHSFEVQHRLFAEGEKKKGVLFFVFAVCAKKLLRPVVSSRKAKNFFWAAVLSSP